MNIPTWTQREEERNLLSAGASIQQHNMQLNIYSHTQTHKHIHSCCFARFLIAFDSSMEKFSQQLGKQDCEP
jgi:hypothetical protein